MPPSRSTWPVEPAAPVVMIVFDEFPVATLIDEQGEIRAEDFPGFARLAQDGTWFRNAVGSHERTEEALPTILSGNWRRSTRRSLPRPSTPRRCSPCSGGAIGCRHRSR